MATLDGKVVFEASGKSHALQFTTNRLCLLEDKLEKSTLDIATELQFNPRMLTIRAMLWAGVANGGMTLADAGDLVDQLGKAVATKLAREAFDAAFPAPDVDAKEGAPNPPDAAAG